MAVSKINPQEPLLREIEISAFQEYLSRNGWTLTDHPNTKLFIYSGPKDDNGKTLILLLPRNKEFVDFYVRLAEAINLVAAVEKKPAREVIQQIIKKVEPIQSTNPVIETSVAVLHRYVRQSMKASAMFRRSCQNKEKTVTTNH